MFYEKDLLKFKKFILSSGSPVSMAKAYQHRHVFLEDYNELTTLHGIHIEPQPFANATGKTISIWATKNTLYPNFVIIKALSRLIQFKSVLEFKEIDVLLIPTLLGLTDMNLVPRVSATSSDSIAPTITTSDNIYITDLTMKSLPTYFLDQFVTMVWFLFLASFILCGLILYGGYEVSGYISRNIILLTLGLLTIMFYGFFESFLSSSLAIRIPDAPFSDLNGLLNAKDYTICTLPMTASNCNIEDMQQMKAQHNPIKCPKYFREYNIMSHSSRTNLTRCPDGKFAYMGFGMYWNTEWNAKCNLVPLAGNYFTNYVSITVSPGFKYREHFNMGSGGHLQYFTTLYARDVYFEVGVKLGRYKYIDERENIAQPVDFSQVTIILMILMAGIFSSMLVFVCEMLTRFGPTFLQNNLHSLS